MQSTTGVAGLPRRMIAVLAPILLLFVWPLGVVLLWAEPRLRARDKWIGALGLPGGLFLAWFIATGVRTDCRTVSGVPIAAGEPGCPAPLAYQLTHPTPWWGFNHVFGPLVLIALVAIPIVTAIYLELRVRRAYG